MATLQEQVTQLGTDAELMHQIVHGDAATEVPTDSGNVPSVQKLFADISAREAANVTQAVTTAGEALAAAGAAQAKAQTAQDEVAALSATLNIPAPAPADASQAIVVNQKGDRYVLATIYTRDEVDAKFVTDSVMSGLIFPFYGTFGGTENKYPVNAATGEVNTAYALCDGGTYTAPDGRQVTVPDLRDRFIVGASGTKAPGTTGGSAQVTATVQETTLTQAQMPSHGHGLLVDRNSGSNDGALYGGRHTPAPRPGFIGATGGSQPHGHGLTSDDEANLPPYYAVAYIMKL